jgi:hypothetical protein
VLLAGALPDTSRTWISHKRGAGKPSLMHYRAFSSFPDTSLFAEGSIQFSFKIRHIPPDPSTLSFPEPPSPMPDHLRSADHGRLGQGTPERVGQHLHKSSGEKADEYRRWDERGREWLYGFVWFEQRRDKEIARGYMQVSRVHGVIKAFIIDYRRRAELTVVEITGHTDTSAFSCPVFGCSSQDGPGVLRARLPCTRSCMPFYRIMVSRLCVPC